MGAGRVGVPFDASLPGHPYSPCMMLQRKLECTADIAHVMMSSF